MTTAASSSAILGVCPWVVCEDESGEGVGSWEAEGVGGCE